MFRSLAPILSFTFFSFTGSSVQHLSFAKIAKIAKFDFKTLSLSLSLLSRERHDLEKFNYCRRHPSV